MKVGGGRFSTYITPAAPGAPVPGLRQGAGRVSNAVRVTIG